MSHLANQNPALPTKPEYASQKVPIKEQKLNDIRPLLPCIQSESIRNRPGSAKAWIESSACDSVVTHESVAVVR